jgi:hypothetical protein
MRRNQRSAISERVAQQREQHVLLQAVAQLRLGPDLRV